MLDALLAQAARAGSYADRVDWVRDALRWIGQDIADARDEAGIGRAHARVRFLLQLAARGTPAGQTVRQLLAQLLLEVDIEQIVTNGGVPRRSGFVKELYERVLAVFLPQPDYRHDATALTVSLLSHRRTIAWIDLLPGEQASQLAQLFVDEGSQDRLHPQIASAMLTIASEAQAVGLAHGGAPAPERPQRAHQPVRPAGRRGRGVHRVGRCAPAGGAERHARAVRERCSARSSRTSTRPACRSTSSIAGNAPGPS